MGSPELETLDQLLSGDLPLSVIRELFPDDAAFMRGVYGLLNSGDVRLFGGGKPDVPSWYWRELFVEGKVLAQLDKFRLALRRKAPAGWTERRSTPLLIPEGTGGLEGRSGRLE